MNSKELFQKDKELTHWLFEVIHSDNWEQARVYAVAQMHDSKKVTAEEINAAKAFVTALESLCAVEALPFEGISSGISHQLDDPNP